MAQAKRARQSVGWGAGLLAGAGAGIVAGLVAAATVIVTHSSLPPAVPTAWSASVAGILGGLVYAWMSRITTRPALALWIITLVLATIDSIFIAVLPFPEGSGTLFGIPIVGLIVPIRQGLALIGIGHFGQHHYPGSDLAAATATHYITAVVVSLLVPRWAGRKEAH